MLKIMNNYLRSSLSQERLSGLAVLSIENKQAHNLDLKGVVKQFAQANARRRIHILN